MAIDSKDLLVQLKAFSRAGSLPLDASEVHDSLEAAQNYAKSAKAYAGQTIKALVDGKYVSYVLQPSADGASLELSKVGVDAAEVKTTTQVVSALPESPEQGVLYINTTDGKGYIYNGSAFKTVFEQVDDLGTTVADTASKVAEAETKLDTILNGSAETEGSLAKNLADAKVYADGLKDTIDADVAKKADADSVYTKEQADSAIQKAITDSGHLKRSIVDALPDTTDADPNTIYMVAKETADGDQQHYDEFMFLNGAFEKIGDTKVDLADYATKAEVDTAKSETIATASDIAADKANAAKDAAIEAAATDASTKADKALEDAKADATSKADKALENAKAYSDGLASNYEKAGAVAAALGEDFPTDTTVKAYVDAQKTAAEDVAKNYTDTQIDTVNSNLNTKVTADQVASAITEKVGNIAEGTTVKDYIDTAVGSGGTASAEAIAKAKSEAIDESKSYTDTALTLIEF